MQAENSRPAILCIAGLDPSGGAGLQADIEAIAHCGGHALPIASCLTVQNSTQASKMVAVDASLIKEQIDALLQDFNIMACKIGVLPNQAVAITIAELLKALPDIPIVLDPVLQASQGISFCDAETLLTIKNAILPNTHIITPNTQELATLSGVNTSEGNNEFEQVQRLCSYGVPYVLVTGADSNTAQVQNTLYSAKGVELEQQWQRLPQRYHGSGCTLSSALACYLAQGMDELTASQKAQQYTWQTLANAELIGQGQRIPKRI